MKQKIRHKFMQCAGLVLALLLVLPAAPAFSAEVQVNPTIRVGLFFGSSALAGGNLLNKVGAGYRFGYFDSGNQFTQLGFTSEAAISVVKTQNVYYGTVDSWSGYYDTPSTGIAVGCYHIQIPGAYTTYQEAVTAAAARSDAFPVWVDGVFSVRVGSYPDSATAQAAMAALGVTGATVAGTSSNGVSVVRTGTSSILFQFDSNNGLSLGVKPGLDDTVKSQTIFRGRTYFGGFQYRRAGGGNLTVTNILPMEDYVQGVIVQEMSPSWPLEALKAQAVCARTYGYLKIQQGEHAAQGFDICNTVDCQAYVGIATASATSIQAVEETAGQYVWYGGALAQTVYFSSDGGATEDSQNVWYSALPYLKGKADPYEAAVADKIEKYNWTVTYTRETLTDFLNSKGYANAGIVDFRVSKTTAMGNVLEITFTDAAGKSWTKTKESARTFLGLRSQRYTISGGSGSYYTDGGGVLPTMNGVYAVDGTGAAAQVPSGGLPYVITKDGTTQLTPPAAVGDTFVVSGSGWGHNIGMSQWGAYAMAQAGQTYDQILKFYFTGIDVKTP